jgi:hypothetical protein
VRERERERENIFCRFLFKYLMVDKWDRFFFNVCYFSRVELHKMKISRPKPEVGKYTMIFHTRDQGNEVNVGR